MRQRTPVVILTHLSSKINNFIAVFLKNGLFARRSALPRGSICVAGIADRSFWHFFIICWICIFDSRRYESVNFYVFTNPAPVTISYYLQYIIEFLRFRKILIYLVFADTLS